MHKVEKFLQYIADSVVICDILFSPHFVLTNTNEYCTDIVYYLDVI